MLRSPFFGSWLSMMALFAHHPRFDANIGGGNPVVAQTFVSATR
jgi:hypothetical protein